MADPERTLILIAPDGPQGGKLKLGVTGQEEVDALKKSLEEKGAALSIDNIRREANNLKIPIVDD